MPRIPYKQLEKILEEMQTALRGRDKQLEEAEAKAKSATDHWIEAEQHKGRAMADGIERAKLEKILRIIGHITAGKSNEAIQELIQPMPVVIGLDIRFADDKSRLMAEDEQLEKVKALVADAVKGVTFKREPEKS